MSEMEGKVSTKLRGCSVEQIWGLIDFFGIGKWHPSLTCQGIEGVSGQPGCIRNCTMTSSYRVDESVEKVEGWAYEKLVAIDRIEKCYSYELLENNIGDFQDEEGEGCELIWSFVVKPVEWQTLEEMVSFIDSLLQIMAKRIEEEVKKE